MRRSRTAVRQRTRDLFRISPRAPPNFVLKYAPLNLLSLLPSRRHSLLRLGGPVTPYQVGALRSHDVHWLETAVKSAKDAKMVVSSLPRAEHSPARHAL